MLKIIITRGIPGSGKTAWAKNFVKKNYRLRQSCFGVADQDENVCVQAVLIDPRIEFRREIHPRAEK